MIGLYFKALLENYQMHIGQLEVHLRSEFDPRCSHRPSPLTRAQDTNEMVVSWDWAEYDSVKQYNVYAVING